MKKNEHKPLPLILSLVSGILLALSFTWKPLSFLIFFLYQPLIHAFYTCSGRKLYARTICFFISFWATLVYWLYVFHPVSLPAVLLGFLVYILLFTLISRLILENPIMPRYLVFPLLWTSFEYLTGQGFLGFPWGLAATPLHFHPLLIQTADLTGVLGTSFFVLLMNALLLEAFMRKKNRVFFTAAGCLLLAVLTYGIIRTSLPVQEEDFKISMIQGNVDPHTQWRQVKYRLFKRLNYLSEQASLENPDLIVWWETAVMDYVAFNLRYQEEASNPAFKRSALFDQKILEQARTLKTPFLIGAPDVIQTETGYNFLNSVLLINTNTEIPASYSKTHLVPFAEWFPYKKSLPFIQKILDSANGGNYTPGTNLTVFRTKDRSFSVLICYEGIFGDLARRQINRGADFLVNITDDMWSFSRRAVYQHSYLDVFRAVENRVSFFRSANSGNTCVIDPHGRIRSSLPLFEPAWLTSPLYTYPNKSKTLYTIWGDWFPKTSLLLSGLLFLTALVKLISGLLGTNK